MSGESTAFVRQYNSRIRELVADNGPPPWAPGSRIVDKRKLMAILSDASAFADFVPSSKEEAALVRKHVRLWRYDAPRGPTSVLRIEQRAMLVLAGGVDDKLRVEQLDLAGKCLMARYEWAQALALLRW